MRADVWGPIGSAVAAACCLGIAPVLSALTALGLGFMFRDWIVIPLLALFLALTVWQLHRDRRRHLVPGPLWLGWVGALLGLAGLWIHPLVVWVGVVLLFAGSIWSLALVWRLRHDRRRRAA